MTHPVKLPIVSVGKLLPRWQENRRLQDATVRPHDLSRKRGHAIRQHFRGQQRLTKPEGATAILRHQRAEKPVESSPPSQRYRRAIRWPAISPATQSARRPLRCGPIKSCRDRLSRPPKSLAPLPSLPPTGCSRRSTKGTCDEIDRYRGGPCFCDSIAVSGARVHEYGCRCPRVTACVRPLRQTPSTGSASHVHAQHRSRKTQIKAATPP